MKTTTINEEMTVQDLINALQKVSNKKQVVACCVFGIEADETIIVDVESERKDEKGEYGDPEEVGLCWLMLPEKSSVHQC